MRRTEVLQGLRLMKFEDVYGKTHRGELSQSEAAEILGMSERTFRRWRDRFEGRARRPQRGSAAPDAAGPVRGPAPERSRGALSVAMADEAMLEKGDVEGVYEGSLFRDRHPSSRIGTRHIGAPTLSAAIKEGLCARAPA